jgi:DNA polymerase epsilon subunit 2
MNFTSEILRIFTKRHGLQVNKEGVDYLSGILRDLSKENVDIIDSLDFIAKSYLQFSKNDSNIVDKSNLEKVYSEIRKTALLDEGVESGGNYLLVLDAFSCPRLKFKDKCFILDQKTPNLLSEASEKAALFKDRFELIYQRLQRNETLNSSLNESTIMPIKNLNGKAPGRYLLFGMLTQMKEGVVFLEDLDSSIELILTPDILMKGPGMFSCSCFVLVHGDYTDDKKFFVHVIGMPPPEARTKSKLAFGNDVDFFGSPDTISDEARLLEIEAKLSDSFFVILSDVWLDSVRVLNKLEELFKGFSLEDTVLPLAFIFNGNFISKPYTFDADDYQKYKGNLM